MRFDYALYALAVMFFVLAAVSVLITSGDTMYLYVVLGAVLGVMSAAAGYAVRPKVQATDVTAQPESVAGFKEPAPAPTPTEAPKAEVAAAETSKVEAPPPMIEAPKVEMAALEKPAEPEALPAAPVPVAPPIVAAAPVEGTPLTQIRGINENRAAQLKANGINNVEELANASAEDLAAKLQVSDKIVKMWIGSARKLAK